MSGEMTHRQRLVDTLLCRDVDRPPLPNWLGLAPWPQTLERWREESGIADLDPAVYFGLEPYFQVVPIEYGPWPHVEPRVLRQDADWIVSTDFRGITMRNRRDGASMPEWIAHPVTDRASWEAYKEEHLQLRLDERLAKLDEFVADVSERDVAVQVGVFPWGVFGTLRDMLGAEECLLSFYTQPDLVRDIIDTYVDLWLALYAAVADEVTIDHLHIWEDMSGKQGSLISMRMVREFMMPAYDRLAAFCQERDIPIMSVDSDGLVDELVPVMMDHGVNAFMPFEVQAGNDVIEVRQSYPSLGILGGLDKTALAVGGRAMHHELERAEEMFALGGWVAGFDHLIPPDVPWEHYATFVTELRRMIGL